MRVFFENRSKKFQLHQYLTRITGILHEDLCTSSTISRLIILRMRYASDKRGRGNQNAHFMFNNTFSWKLCRFWDGVEKYGRARQAVNVDRIRHMCIVWWKHEATDLHWEYAILLAFPRQQLLRERVSMLHLYVHYLSWYLLFSLHISHRDVKCEDKILNPQFQ